jgi:hypothetical protein
VLKQSVVEHVGVVGVEAENGCRGRHNWPR